MNVVFLCIGRSQNSPRRKLNCLSEFHLPSRYFSPKNVKNTDVYELSRNLPIYKFTKKFTESRFRKLFFALDGSVASVLCSVPQHVIETEWSLLTRNTRQRGGETGG